MIRHTRRRHIIGLAAIGGAIGFVSPAYADTKDYLGDWSGTVDFGDSAKLRFRLLIASETSAQLYNIDQGGGEIKAAQVQVTPDGVTMEFSDWGMRLAGSLKGLATLQTTLTLSDGKRVVADFARGDLFKYAPLSAELLANVRQSTGAPAMAAACARNGGKPTIFVEGLRSLNAATKVAPDDAWCIGSVTKSMTATLVGRLIDAGHVGWDVTVADVLGSSIPGMQDSYRRATLRNLLNHRAGLRREIDPKDYSTFSLDGLDDPRAERLKWASHALTQAPLGAPGEKTAYANSGYVVVGAMLEALRGKSWEQLMREEVFGPLGLRSAGFGAPGISGKLDQPLGHSVSPTDPGKLIPVELAPGKAAATPIAKAPAGRVHINMADLVAYLNAHLLRPSPFLKPDTWTTLHTPPDGADYAMGWGVDTNGRLNHDGSNGFWWAQVAVDPATRTVAAAAANDGDGNKMFAAVGQLIQSGLVRAQKL